LRPDEPALILKLIAIADSCRTATWKDHVASFCSARVTPPWRPLLKCALRASTST